MAMLSSPNTKSYLRGSTLRQRPADASSTSTQARSSNNKRESTTSCAEVVARKRRKTHQTIPCVSETLASACTHEHVVEIEHQVASSFENAATDIESDGQLNPNPHLDKLPASVDDPADAELPESKLQEACVALGLKLERDRHGSHQYGRRLKSEPFKLSDSQKKLMAISYRAARYEDRAVDYDRMSNSVHFKTFKDNAEQLREREPSLLHELKAALIEQRQLEAGLKVMTNDEWEEELARCEVLHQKETSDLKDLVRLVREHLAAAVATTNELCLQLTSLKADNAAFKKQQAQQKSAEEKLTQQSEQQKKAQVTAWAVDQLEEDFRLAPQKEFNDSVMTRIHKTLDDERSLEEQLAWRKEKEEKLKELHRTIRALKGQIERTDYSKTVGRWRAVSEALEKERRELLATPEGSRLRESELPSTLEDIF